MSRVGLPEDYRIADGCWNCRATEDYRRAAVKTELRCPLYVSQWSGAKEVNPAGKCGQWKKGTQ